MPRAKALPLMVLSLPVTVVAHGREVLLSWVPHGHSVNVPPLAQHCTNIELYEY